MKILKSLVCAALCLPIWANATTFDVSQLSHGNTRLRISHDIGSFSDQINFGLEDQRSVDMSVRNVFYVSQPPIINLTIKLYDSHNTLLTKFYSQEKGYYSPLYSQFNIASMANNYSNGIAGGGVALLSDLNAGYYHLTITGETTSTAPMDLSGFEFPAEFVGDHLNKSYGSYQVNLNPTPEPETYAMLLLGLGSIGYVKRKKLLTTRMEQKH
ncbi:MAG: FxDxF family PEP-CTERM protein [Pseudomonadota bacterium]